jgi:hypothetical protein
MDELSLRADAGLVVVLGSGSRQQKTVRKTAGIAWVDGRRVHRDRVCADQRLSPAALPPGFGTRLAPVRGMASSGPSASQGSMANRGRHSISASCRSFTINAIAIRPSRTT